MSIGTVLMTHIFLAILSDKVITNSMTYKKALRGVFFRPNDSSLIV